MKPWTLDDEFSIYDGDDHRVAVLRDHGTEQHAALIVKAVNDHAELLAALKEMVTAHSMQNIGVAASARRIKAVTAARAAIAKAEGRS